MNYSDNDDSNGGNEEKLINNLRVQSRLQFEVIIYSSTCSLIDGKDCCKLSNKLIKGPLGLSFSAST